VRRQDNDVWASVARYTAVATLLPAFAFTGFAIGYGLDYLFSTHFMRLVFLLLGVAGGLVQVVRELTRDKQ
jgi:F0F1-type ATP synthase assembly protein I